MLAVWFGIALGGVPGVVFGGAVGADAGGACWPQATVAAHTASTQGISDLRRFIDTGFLAPLSM